MGDASGGAHGSGAAGGGAAEAGHGHGAHGGGHGGGHGGFGSPSPDPKPHGPLKALEIFTESVVFGSRWIQAPLYVGLIVAELVYAYRFALELLMLIQKGSVASTHESEIIVLVLGLVDITMVANLIAMIVIGGYATFVSKLNVDAHEDRPDWLDKIDAATMKIKLSASLVGISSVHLLKTFIDMAPERGEEAAHAAATAIPVDFQVVKYQIIIHAMFLLSSVMLALSERILHGPPHHD